MVYYLHSYTRYKCSFSSDIDYIELVFSFVSLVIMDKAQIIPRALNSYFFSVHSKLLNVVCTLC